MSRLNSRTAKFPFPYFLLTFFNVISDIQFLSNQFCLFKASDRTTGVFFSFHSLSHVIYNSRHFALRTIIVWEKKCKSPVKKAMELSPLLLSYLFYLISSCHLSGAISPPVTRHSGSGAIT